MDRDGQTEGQSIYHASIVTHDKNWQKYYYKQ